MEAGMPKIACVVVTYNRKKLLMECLGAVLGQSVQVHTLVLIDNASTDGTRDALRQAGLLDDPRIIYRLMDKNTGGSGGFYEGIRMAREMDVDWLWVMDDDTIPGNTCLENLIRAQRLISASDRGNEKRPISFLASAIYGPEGEYMNLPTLDAKPSGNGYAYWYQFLQDGIVNICDATFVSLLISMAAVRKCGLPNRDYFIWGDDGEYTTRMTRFYGDAYFVGNSVAIHKRLNAKALDIEHETDPKRIRMYKYLYRNNAINDRYYKKRNHVAAHCVRNILVSPLQLRKKHGFDKMLALFQGNWEALTKYSYFKKYIDDQIQ